MNNRINKFIILKKVVYENIITGKIDFHRSWDTIKIYFYISLSSNLKYIKK